MGLAWRTVADIGVEGMPVVGGLKLAAWAFDGAEPAGDAWAQRLACR